VCVGGGRWHGWHSPASLEGAVVALVADARQHRRVDERVAGIAHALSIGSRPNARDCNPRERPADDQVRICAPEARRREGRQHTAAQTRMGTSPFPLSPLSISPSRAIHPGAVHRTVWVWGWEGVAAYGAWWTCWPPRGGAAAARSCASWTLLGAGWVTAGSQRCCCCSSRRMSLRLRPRGLRLRLSAEQRRPSLFFSLGHAPAEHPQDAICNLGAIHWPV
jgi:hypothetical protein